MTAPQGPEATTGHTFEQLNPTESMPEYSGAELLGQFKELFGVNFVTGLPCGELRGLIAASATDDQIDHYPATNEREAIGIATGAWLGGKTPAIYMQNSGLLVASNEIGSLMIPSEVPAVLAVSWRGALGETATQHLAPGRATRPLMHALGIQHTTHPTKEELMSLGEARSITNLPVAVLQVREQFNDTAPLPISEQPSRYTTEVVHGDPAEPSSREAMLDIVASKTPSTTAVISSTGLISRSQYAHHDSDNQFYNAGGFGVTSSIALGVALAQPNRQVIAIEGDGSVLTNPGNLNLIGGYAPNNLVHVVLDNKAYGSCSGETTMGSELIPQMAALQGYKRVFAVTSEADAIKAMNEIMNHRDGPQMLHISINTTGARNFVRPVGMAEIAARFHNFLNG